MIPYEVIKEEKSDKTIIKCGYCFKIFETVQHHELHRCRKERNFIGQCLSCGNSYNYHAVPKSDSGHEIGAYFILFGRDLHVSHAWFTSPYHMHIRWE